MSEVSRIAGTARRRRDPPKWLKRPGDERECGTPDCTSEAWFVPNVTVWAKDDPQHTGRHAVIILPIALCKTCSDRVVSERDLHPDAKAIESLTELLGGKEPDLETMAIRFFGNHCCSIDRALEIAKEAEGAWTQQYDESTGKLKAVKVG